MFAAHNAAQAFDPIGKETLPPGMDAAAPVGAPGYDNSAVSQAKIIAAQEAGVPLLPQVMPDDHYALLKERFFSPNEEKQRKTLCTFAERYEDGKEKHTLRLVKPMIRLYEEGGSPLAMAKEERDTVAYCALRILTKLLTLHAAFEKSVQYKNIHPGGVGSPPYIRQHIVPIYLRLLQAKGHPLHQSAYYIFMMLGEDYGEKVAPILVKQLQSYPRFTEENSQALWDILRALHKMGTYAKPALPHMVRLIMDEGTVEYEGDFGADGKRGFNAELAAAMVNVVGDEEKWIIIVLKAINHAIAYDNNYWKDQLRPEELNGGTDITASMKKSKQKLLKRTGLDEDYLL